MKFTRTSMVVQWLRLYASNSGSVDLITCRGTESPHTMAQSKKKKKKYSNVKWAWNQELGIIWLYFLIISIFLSYLKSYPLTFSLSLNRLYIYLNYNIFHHTYSLKNYFRHLLYFMNILMTVNSTHKWLLRYFIPQFVHF